MPDHEALIEALAKLDPLSLGEVVNTAYRRRGDAEVAVPEMPDHQATPERLAPWLAQRHLATDAAIERVVDLPAGAPEDEIRLLEVNRFLNPSDGDLIEPLDFTPDMDLPHRVFVADITSDQWGRVQLDPEAHLLPGWRLDDHQVIIRG